MQKRIRRAAPWWTLSLLGLALLVSGANAQSAETGSAPPFPVPRAEKEFVALIPGLKAYAKHATPGDMKAFVSSATLYGPLDLQVRKADTPKDAFLLRSFYLGLAAFSSGLPETASKQIGQPFQHSPAAIQSRKQRLVAQLPQISAFVTSLQSQPQIRLLAHWGIQDEYRVNDTFQTMGQTKEALPSPNMGFVPSGQWKSYASVAAYLDTIHVSPAAFDRLYQQFQPLLVVAADRTSDDGTEIVGLGIGTKTSGLLFCHSAASRPALGNRLPDGRRYIDVEQVKLGIYYFETN